MGYMTSASSRMPIGRLQTSRFETMTFVWESDALTQDYPAACEVMPMRYFKPFLHSNTSDFLNDPLPLW